MPQTTFLSLVPRLLPYAPSCPQPTALAAIRRGAIKACEKSLSWRYTPTVFTLTDYIPEYTFTVPVGSEVHAVIAATLNDMPLKPATLEDALRSNPEWAPVAAIPGDPVEKAGTPKYITQITPDKFLLIPTPNDTVYNVRMFLALKPTRLAVDMDSVACSSLEECIMHAALEELLVIPNVPWADREGASYHARQFSYKINEARARANLGNARASMTVHPVPFR
jgi:hypothetical protein